MSLRIPAYVAQDAKIAASEPESSTRHAIQYGAQELIKTAASEEAVNRLREMASLPYDEILQHRVMYGTPEAVVHRIHDYQEKLGITGVVLEVNYGGQMPKDQVSNSVRLLAEKVMPEFK